MAHTNLPPTLPAPTDDGGAAHLPGSHLPPVLLPAGNHSPPTLNPTDLSSLPGTSIVFFYPRTAGPSESVPDAWNAIPGARGCTPQACGFRDLHAGLTGAGADRVFGVSTQSCAWQAEVAARTGLPYALLSDEGLALTRALRLPTFEWEGEVLIKRMAAVVRDGVFVKVFYPVFPPDRSAGEVLEWMGSAEGKAALGM